MRCATGMLVLPMFHNNCSSAVSRFFQLYQTEFSACPSIVPGPVMAMFVWPYA